MKIGDPDRKEPVLVKMSNFDFGKANFGKTGDPREPVLVKMSNSDFEKASFGKTGDSSSGELIGKSVIPIREN